MTLAKHLQILDAALDAWQSQEWTRRRDAAATQTQRDGRWLWGRMRARQANRDLAGSVSK